MPRAFGTDRLETSPGGRVRLLCRSPKAWVARKPAGPGLALHPGTAVRWDDDLWEVTRAEGDPDGGISYELAPWDDQHAIRVLLRYDERSEAERAADGRDLARRRAAARVAYLLSPVAGLLPGEVQERLELELGAKATLLTLASLAAPFAVGTYATVMTMASSVGAAAQVGGPALEAALPLLALLLPESLVRLVVVMAQGRPIGSVLGLPLYLAARLTGLLPPAPRDAGTANPSLEHRLADRFLVLEPLLSFLPAADQLLLRDRRGFEPVTWGRRTAWLLFVYPGLTAPAHAAHLLAGGGLRSLLFLVLALVFAVEQVRRLGVLARGEPAPGLLGPLVRPFAAPLLR